MRERVLVLGSGIFVRALRLYNQNIHHKIFLRRDSVVKKAFCEMKKSTTDG